MPDSSARIWAILGGLLLLTVVIVALRWTFGTDRTVPTARLADPTAPDAFGLLEEVSRVPGAVAAEVLRGRLAAAGIRATLSRDGPAYRILVFPDDLKAARVVLSRGSID
jgi:hypothetical protein